MQRVASASEVEERFWSKVDKTGDCWLWTASCNKYGYGNIRVGGRQGKLYLAHRFSYELLVGEIPNGLELDHLCGTRACVRPSHLEPVTHAENVRRGKAGEYQRLKTHCPNEHEYTPENTVARSWRGYQHRACRTCRREAARRSMQRHRERQRENTSP